MNSLFSIRGLVCTVATTMLSLGVFAAESASNADSKHFTNESEVAIVTTTGNTTTESYSAKTKNVYTLDMNIFTNKASYLQSKSNGAETARNWDFGLRYDRMLNETMGLYLGHLVESNSYSGFVQRHSTDLGGKYLHLTGEKMKWQSEAGYRYQDSYTTLGQHEYAQFGRLYTEFFQALNETVSYKMWAEYLPNLKENDAYQANGEASVTSIMSQIFSLKLAYLAKYANIPSIANGQRLDSTFTTSLVAKF